MDEEAAKVERKKPRGKASFADRAGLSVSGGTRLPDGLIEGSAHAVGAVAPTALAHDHLIAGESASRDPASSHGFWLRMPSRRKPLHHTPPASVANHSWFFITLCCARRGANQLCRREAAAHLLADGIHYHLVRHWALHLLLLMPDHLHLIAGFPASGPGMSETIRNWKRLAARKAGIEWQRNYFDHRIRRDEGLDLKADYVRQNPVRAGLISSAKDWPFFVDGDSVAGR